MKLLYVAEIIRPDAHFVVLDYLVQVDAGNPQAGSDVEALIWAMPSDLDDLPMADGMHACLAESEVRRTLQLD